MKKWLKRLIIGLVLIACVLAFSAKLLLTKEFLVEEIEDSINSRVQIGSFDVSLFSIPAKITLQDVILAERDNNVNRKVPYNERAPLTQGALECKEVSFDVSLWELLSREIYVEHFVLDGLHARVKLHEDGTNSLDSLFEDVAKEDQPKEKSKSFNAREKDEFVTQLKSISISNVSFDLTIEKTGVFLQGEDYSVELEDIKVNPNALELVNQAKLKLAGNLQIYDSASKTLKYGEIGLSGNADVQLFDPMTGYIDPDVTLDLDISDSSYLTTKIPYVEKIWDFGSKLEKYGVSFDSLPKKASFGRSRKIAGSYKRGRVDVTRDLSIVIHDWEVAVNEKSWLSSGSEQHEFFIDLSASQKSSQSLVGHIDSLLKNVPKELRGGLANSIKQEWLVNGKLTLSLQTKGVLSKPKIKMITKLPNVDDLIKDYAKKGAVDFLFKQFGR
ncbi:AsmA family protein [Rubritalea profundi]|uniref:AsmA domain-containing protein n=1 Tax=Rubritalea profundi TaxID=1658618 RepID=A0A2S7TXQ7_9BACT|nr:AsmA family protein [Rubritalea profundi]PQJ27545.1 hypothetical protein BSZ32_02900 [Rubritalea profundi]